MKLKFEWDPAKAEANWKKHGVSFELAKEVFRDPFAIQRADERADYAEERFVIIGWRRTRSCFQWHTQNETTTFA
jgi:uncharacterized DUF497 family protein